MLGGGVALIAAAPRKARRHRDRACRPRSAGLTLVQRLVRVVVRVDHVGVREEERQAAEPDVAPVRCRRSSGTRPGRTAARCRLRQRAARQLSCGLRPYVPSRNIVGVERVVDRRRRSVPTTGLYMLRVVEARECEPGIDLFALRPARVLEASPRSVCDRLVVEADRRLVREDALRRPGDLVVVAWPAGTS